MLTVKNTYPILFVTLLMLSLGSGCSTFRDYPKYDQVLVYDRAYDYTFLRTMEALNTVKGWSLEETDKEKGLIVIRNTEYGNLFDRDKWIARFIVKRLERKKTSVSLDPATQRVSEGGTLLKRIDHVMTLAGSVQGEQRSQLLS